MTNVHDLRRDPMLKASWLRACATRYAGTDLENPEVSPLLGDLTGLPPLLVHAASDEILRPDAERLVAHARAAGVPVTYRCLDRMWHVAHLHAGLMKAATAAVAEIGDFLIETTTKEASR
jgi:acetyl esterase/lipase